MSIPLFLLVVILSAVLSAFFVLVEAKKFATAPPTPLIDLDRMYDRIFLELNEDEGSAMTPEDLKIILGEFIVILSKNDLIQEDLSIMTSSSISDKKLHSEMIAQEIEKQCSSLGVPSEVIRAVVGYSLDYLKEIGAIV